MFTLQKQFLNTIAYQHKKTYALFAFHHSMHHLNTFTMLTIMDGLFEKKKQLQEHKGEKLMSNTKPIQQTSDVGSQGFQSNECTQRADDGKVGYQGYQIVEQTRRTYDMSIIGFQSVTPNCVNSGFQGFQSVIPDGVVIPDDLDSGFQGSIGYQGFQRQRMTRCRCCLRFDGDKGYQEYQRDLYFRLPSCSQHSSGKRQFFSESMRHITHNQRTLKECYDTHGNSLPCFVLDYVGNNREKIEYCKQLGATCCHPNRSNLARVLLGIPIITYNRFRTHLFDREIQLGNIDRVKFMIWGEFKLENADQYDEDLIITDFLRNEMLHYHLSYTTLIDCVINVICNYLSWYDIKQCF